MGEKNVKMRWIALLALVMLLLLGVGGASAEETTTTAIDLVFDGKMYTDTVQVEWTEKYPVPEGGVKWDGTEEFIGYAEKENWRIINTDEFSYGEGQIAFMANLGTPFDVVEQIAAKYNARIVAYLALTENYVIELIKDKSLLEMCAVIEKLKEETVIISDTVIPHYVEYFDLNAIPNDPWGGDVEWTESPSGINWNMEAINASQAWEYAPFMNKEIITIVDGMFDDSHEDIDYAAIRDTNWDTINSELSYADNAHGTHVTGIALAIHNNDLGISGVYPKGQAFAIGILGQNNEENVAWVIDYCEWFLRAIINDSHVINASLGWSNDALKDVTDSNRRNEIAAEAYRTRTTEHSIINGEEIYVVNSAISHLNHFFDTFPLLAQSELNSKYNFDFVFINSAGNDAVDTQYNWWTQAITSSFFTERFINVSSVELNEGIIDYYNRHNWGHNISVFAPGRIIYSTVPTDIYNLKRYANGFLEEINGINYAFEWSGTSMAAPHATGVAAMIWSIAPSITGADVKRILCNSDEHIMISDQHGNSRPLLDAQACVHEAFMIASGNGNLSVDVIDQNTGDYIYDVQVCIKPLEICQVTKTTTESTGVVYPYMKTLKLGQYEVTVSKDGYQSYTEKITVTRDSEININATLKPIDAPEVTKGKLNGMVTFNAQGVNDIKVNVLKGTTSVITLITANGYFDVDLEPGTYTLSIDADGYVPTSRDITVFTGKTTTENIELDDAMYAVATQTMNTSIQYDVKLFNANDSITQLDMKVTLRNGTVLMDTANGIRSGVTMRADGFAFQIDDELAQGAQLEVTAADGQRRTYSGAIVLSSGLWSGTKKLPDSRSNGGYWDANGFYHESKY